MIGTILDEKYRIERLLGEGGMGAVYAAEDVRSGEQVAVKVIHTHLTAQVPDIAARFEREARAAAGVDTEHIVRCLDAGTDAATRQPYMVLEFLHGEDLQRVLKRTGPVSPDLALRVTAQACVGLSRAHEANIVHRDIKPANLFLARRRESDGERVVKILDFGVAKIVRRDPNEQSADNDGLTRTGSMLGSPLYMSPEQARSVKSVDQRADIWSLGVVLYKALAGRTPFDHISSLGDLVLALWNEPPPPVQQFAPWVSPDVAALLDRMLRVEPAERFQTMAEVLEALTPFLPGGTKIDESMLVPISEDARQRTAATFFRRFDTKRTLDRPRTDPAPQRAPTGSPPAEAPAADAPRQETSPGVAVSATTGDSSPGPLTRPGLGATDPGSVVAASPRKLGRGTAALLALVGLALGGGTTMMFVSRSGAGTAASGTAPAITAAPPVSTPPATTVTPAPDPSTTATTSAPAATAAPSASASVTATATAAVTAPSVAVPPPVRPKGSAAPTATAGGTATKPGFTDFGDRK